MADKANWKQALQTFLKNIQEEKKEIIGALVCGSYVTGNPDEHSDIDVHLILKKGTKWKERGNRIINKFLIEYFANPAEEISNYFAEDHKNSRQDAITQFLTGEILFDDGSIAKLKKEAKKWYNKPFAKLKETDKKMIKYDLWDRLDNLESAHKKKQQDFLFIYHTQLLNLLESYCQYVGYPKIKADKVVKLFTEKKTREKYLAPEFSDKQFTRLFLQAINTKEHDKAMILYKKLTNHVLKAMGDFNIDGWKLRTELKKQ